MLLAEVLTPILWDALCTGVPVVLCALCPPPFFLLSRIAGV